MEMEANKELAKLHTYQNSTTSDVDPFQGPLDESRIDMDAKMNQPSLIRLGESDGMCESPSEPRMENPLVDQSETATDDVIIQIPPDQTSVPLENDDKESSLSRCSDSMEGSRQSSPDLEKPMSRHPRFIADTNLLQLPQDSTTFPLDANGNRPLLVPRIVTNIGRKPSEPGEPEQEKRKVEIHVTFLKIGEINTLKEMYEADIMIKSKWREPALDPLGEEELADINWDNYWNPKIIIDNARPDVKETFSRHVVREDNDTYVRERRRFRGTFLEPLELWDFPFDVQDLSINVMSDLPSSEVDLVETYDDIHRIYRQSFIDEQEYYLYKYVGTEKRILAKERTDPSIRRSTIYARCVAARRIKYFIYNLFLVIFIIAFLSFVAYAVQPEKVENRLQLGFTLLLTSVAFKLAATQSLPRIPYLTYLDRYSIATITVVFLNTIWFGVMVFIPIPKDEHGRAKADFIALGVLSSAYLLYNVHFMLTILLIPSKRRREMKRKEMYYMSKLRQRALNRRTANSDSDDDSVTVKRTKNTKRRPSILNTV